MATTQRVFICSTQVDLLDERAGVIDAIARLQLQHESMEFFGARPNQPLSTCIEQVRQSDILVVIVGDMYGTIAPDLGVSYSEAEYDEGYRLGKPCLAYFRGEDVPILTRFMEKDPEKRKLLTALREKIQARHTIAYFRDNRDLSLQVSADLAKLISNPASDDALSIIRKGRRAWNIWRMDHEGNYPDLANANLSGQNLSGFDLSHVNLFNANLQGADLSSSNFTEANLVQANLNSATLRNTVFSNSNLRDAIVEDCIHKGQSFVDMFTLRNSTLPISFLRGCGVPDTIIDYLPSLMSGPVQFYSCFLAYSVADSSFVDRLHADLQDKGVRCWFAPHDLPLGAKTWEAIDEAIRRREKLLVVLSEASIASEWVEDEVNHAYAEERSRKEIVLFPIRIDDAVMSASEPWTMKLRDQRNIGDFRGWRDPATYRQSLERLLRDLKVSSR
jgi:hypothetical protein